MMAAVEKRLVYINYINKVWGLSVACSISAPWSLKMLKTYFFSKKTCKCFVD